MGVIIIGRHQIFVYLSGMLRFDRGREPFFRNIPLQIILLQSHERLSHRGSTTSNFFIWPSEIVTVCDIFVVCGAAFGRVNTGCYPIKQSFIILRDKRNLKADAYKAQDESSMGKVHNLCLCVNGPKQCQCCSTRFYTHRMSFAKFLLDRNVYEKFLPNVPSRHNRNNVSALARLSYF